MEHFTQAKFLAKCIIFVKRKENECIFQSFLCPNRGISLTSTHQAPPERPYVR